MKITFLGTAAAEAIPALWCECPVCAKAKKLGGKELRRRCSYLIDDDTMVDFGPDAFWQSVAFQIDLVNLKRVIFTHPHGDHLNPLEFLWRRAPWFSQVSHDLAVIGARTIFARLLNQITSEGTVYKIEDLRIRPLEAQAGVPMTDGDMELLPLAADHAPGLEPLIYVIGRGGRRILIANDTGYLPEESWRKLEGVKLDAAVIDSTCGFQKCSHLHQGVESVVAFRRRLVEMGCLAADAPAVANHFSHNGRANHEDLVAYFAPHGMEVAWDGMVLEL